jgi:hypothetical protein
MPSAGIGIYGFHRSWNGYANGHGSWSSSVPSGSDQMWYIENCGFNFMPAGATFTTIDGYAGWRYCVRYSSFTNQTIEGHGYESAESRGTRYVECYMNNFVNTNGGQIASYLRSGEQICFSNRMDGLSGTTPFKLIVDRATDELTVIGGATGRNPFDSNSVVATVTGTVSSAGTLTMTDSGKSWTTDQWVGFTVRKTSGIAISSMTRSGALLSIDTSAAHGLTAGMDLTIFGADQIGYNTGYPAAFFHAGDSDSFTLDTAYAPTSPSTGTRFVITNNSFSTITANTATQLTFTDSIYTPNKRLTFSAGDTYEINKVSHIVDQPGAGVSSAQSSSPPSAAGWSQGLAICSEWGNTNQSGTAVHFEPSSPSIVAGVHYTNAVKVGYSPYVYPHPLVSGISPFGHSRTFGARPQSVRGVFFR